MLKPKSGYFIAKNKMADGGVGFGINYKGLGRVIYSELYYICDEA